MFRNILILGFLLLLGITFANAQEKVKWISFEEAVEKMETEKRKIFIDMYTDWCGWCKKMDAATFQQPHIAKYLNENFYPVKFDAEQKEEINYKGKVYKYVKSGRRGYHELAAELALGKLSYPTIIFVSEELEVLQPIPGYQNPNMFEVIMTYFAEEHYENTPWKKYHDSYDMRIKKSYNMQAGYKGGNQE